MSEKWTKERRGELYTRAMNRWGVDAQKRQLARAELGYERKWKREWDAICEAKACAVCGEDLDEDGRCPICDEEENDE
jgi:rubrerythrin